MLVKNDGFLDELGKLYFFSNILMLKHFVDQQATQLQLQACNSLDCKKKKNHFPKKNR